MITKYVLGSTIALMAIGGFCEGALGQAPTQYAPAPTQMPTYCMVDNTAAGASTGSAIGLLGGGMAGGLRGALIGSLAGATFGGLTGAQADAQCQQLALQIAYHQAAAQQSSMEQQVAKSAMAQGGYLTLPESAYQPVYADYKTPSNGHRHRITIRRTNSYSVPAAQQICDSFSKIDSDLDSNTTATSPARRCKGPDGQWRDAA